MSSCCDFDYIYVHYMPLYGLAPTATFLPHSCRDLAPQWGKTVNYRNICFTANYIKLVECPGFCNAAFIYLIILLLAGLFTVSKLLISRVI